MHQERRWEIFVMSREKLEHSIENRMNHNKCSREKARAKYWPLALRVE